VEANIKQPGRVLFRYKNPTQVDEYLLLLDLRSRNDHRAQLFDLLYKAFVREEVLIERFFYDGDLRLCWNERFPNGLAIKDLQHKYSEQRLIVVGSGDALFSPLTGRLERWTAVFEQWKHRSFLLTTPIAHWRSQEAELDGLFRLAPASLNGLLWLVNSDAAPDDRDKDYWSAQPDAQALPLILQDDLSEAALLAALEAEYTGYTDRKPDDRVLRWLAACAISPVIHWDATLFLGKFCDDNPRHPLLTLENIQSLNRLAWFQQGKMPEKARKALLNWMEREYPQDLVAVRQAWQTLLEDNLLQLQAKSLQQKQGPFEQSMAFEEMRLQMIVNELALDKLQNQVLPLERRQRLEEELDRLKHRAPADFVALELLAEIRLASELRLQTAVHQTKENKQLPILLAGWRWQFPIFFLLALSLWMFDGVGKRCNGELWSYAPAGDLCISNLAERAIFMEQLWCDVIDFDTAHSVIIRRSSTKIDSASRKFLGFSGEDTSFQIQKTLDYDWDYFNNPAFDPRPYNRNIATALWNAGLRASQEGRKDVACKFLNDLLRMGMARDSILNDQELKFINSLCFSDFGNAKERPAVQQNIAKPTSKSKPIRPGSIGVTPSRRNTPPPTGTRIPPARVQEISTRQQEAAPIQTTQNARARDALKPLVLPSTPEEGRFYVRLNTLDVISKLRKGQVDLKLVGYASTPQNLRAQYWEGFKEYTNAAEKREILIAYIEFLTQGIVEVSIDNIGGPQKVIFGDTGFVIHQGPEIPDNINLYLAVYENDKVTKDDRAQQITSGRDFEQLFAELQKLQGMGSATALENKIVTFIIENYAGPVNEPLGVFNIPLDRKSDYAFGERKRSGVRDRFNRFTMDYSMFGYTKPVKKE
jgi:hypothetical protein